MFNHANSEMPSCSTIDLAEIQRSSKISPWIWSIISGVVTVLGRPGRGTSQVEKSRLNWTTQFLSFWRWHTMVHDLLMFLSEWRVFPSAPCLAGGDLTARVSMLKSRASPDILSASVTRKDLQFDTWTDPFPTTLSIPFYIGKEVGLRTYQHPLVPRLMRNMASRFE